MSIKEYEAGRRLELRAMEIRNETGANEFYSLIQAAMRQADEWNMDALKAAFPGIAEDLQARYNAGGGILPSDGAEPKEQGE